MKGLTVGLIKRLQVRETKEFKSTNWIWNNLELNKATQIGRLTYLFKLSGATNFLEWQNFYFNSGHFRLKELARLSKSCNIENQNEKVKELNNTMGRTKKELNELGYILYKELKRSNHPYYISLDNCKLYVHIRVIDETFLGMQRELNTIKKLNTKLCKFEVVATDYHVDVKYAVDCEIISNGQLVCGIQIKSSTYLKSNNTSIRETKKCNLDKNRKYSNLYKVPVFYVYSDTYGNIQNYEIIHKIRTMQKGSLNL